jgi:hypothetical protein
MVHRKGDYLGGVRDLEDLRQRCRISEEGCWLWGMSCDKNDGAPMVWVRKADGTHQKMRGRMAAMHLAYGRDPPPKHRAFPRWECCRERTCVNPGHTRLGTITEWWAYIVESGQSKSPAKTAANRRTARARLAKITMDDARAIRGSNESTYALAAKYGIAQSAIWNIQRGRTWREAARGASVFNLGSYAMEGS